MTAIFLFDVLADEPDTGRSDSHRMVQLAQFAGKLVESSLADWRRILDVEQEIGSLEHITPQKLVDVSRSVYEMYEAWAREAEQVLSRIRHFSSAGYPVSRSEDLEDAYAKVSNRLALTPEKISRAIEQVRQGLAIPMQEIRDGLNARIRAGR
jgi:hypothetical protein